MLVHPFTSQESTAIAQKPISHGDADRIDRMKKAWDAYRGKFKQPLKIAKDQPDDNVLVNRCAPIVDKGVSFLFGPVVQFSVPNRDLEIEKCLQYIWGSDDDKMTLLSQAAINGGVCGQVFIKIIPPQGPLKYPKLVVLNPMTVRIVTPPDDCSLVIAYIIEYPGDKNTQNKQIIARVDPDGYSEVAGYEDIDDTWTITNYKRFGQAGSWVRIGDTEEWSYPFPPIMCCQNLPNPNEIWGTPDLTSDIIEMNSVINFNESNISRILKYHAHPKSYATGLTATQIDMSVDSLICLPNENAMLRNLEMTSDLHSSLNFVASLRSDMDEQSRVPGVALGRLVDLPRGTISGVALELLFQPLIEKTIQKRRLYGKLIRDVSKACLCIMDLINIDDFDEFDIDLQWQNLLPVDNLVAAQTAILLLQVGVSRRSVMEKLGYDPDVEAAKIQKTPQPILDQVSSNTGGQQ